MLPRLDTALSRLGNGPEVILPSESTIRRTLAAVDADNLDAKVGAWIATRVGHLAGRTVIAVDGKSMRGAGSAAKVMPHLLAALHHNTGVGGRPAGRGGQEQRDPRLAAAIAGFDLTGVVVTADALHCQRGTAAYITARGGHYVLTVKANQWAAP